MKKYSVRLYFHTFMNVEVEAENKEDAIDMARWEDVGSYCQDIVCNCEEDDEPDVELIEEDRV